jgi:hypothetical protein
VAAAEEVQGCAPFGVPADRAPEDTREVSEKRLDVSPETVEAAFGNDAGESFTDTLAAARRLAAAGRDVAATQTYVALLRQDPTHLAALCELGALACARGHRSAARTAYTQAVRYHPGSAVGRISLGNILAAEGDPVQARLHYEAALAADPERAEAHQGLARVFPELACETSRGACSAVKLHWEKGFRGHAMVSRPYRGTGPAPSVLLLVAACGGNIPLRHWINDRCYAVTVIYADFHDPAQDLPPHALVVNAIGDADLCGRALAGAAQVVARSTAPVMNQPARVAATGRVANARRLRAVPGVIAPRTVSLPRRDILAAEDWRFPLLLRAPGFHTGRHFVRVEHHEALARAVAALPGEELLAIEYLDARGPDGMARKYRVMFIDGAAYPLHLAISADWKVHHFTSGMAERADHREEERRFLADMPRVLGARAMAALAGIASVLGLEYAGVDFALAPDGSVLLFEANATMVINSPDPGPIWDYRRPVAAAVLGAVADMLRRRGEEGQGLCPWTPLKAEP